MIARERERETDLVHQKIPIRRGDSLMPDVQAAVDHVQVVRTFHLSDLGPG